MNIIITGASSGIGYETVKALAAREGHNIIAIARNQEKLKALQKETKGSASAVSIISFDLTQPDYNPLVQQVKEKLSLVNILINNAGTLINKPFIQTKAEDLYQTFEANFFSAFRLIQALIPLFGAPHPFGKEKGVESHILNIGSMGGYQGSGKYSGLSAYSASKAAVANLTESLAEELKEQDIKVNCLALGAVQTEMLKKAFPGYEAPMSAETMGKYIADFALTGHNYYNGKVLPVSASTP